MSNTTAYGSMLDVQYNSLWFHARCPIQQLIHRECRRYENVSVVGYTCASSPKGGKRGGEDTPSFADQWNNNPRPHISFRVTEERGRKTQTRTPLCLEIIGQCIYCLIYLCLPSHLYVTTLTVTVQIFTNLVLGLDRIVSEKQVKRYYLERLHDDEIW
jgi:hypothetical protein